MPLRFVTLTALVFTLAGSPALANQGAQNGQPFQHLQEQIDLLTTDLAEVEAFLQGQIDDLVASQASQDTLIAALQSAVLTLGERVTANETDIAALEAWRVMQDQLLAALNTRLVALEDRVATNENDISAIILADQVTQQLIDATIQQMQTLETMVDGNTGDIGALADQMAALDAELAGLEADLLAKQDRVLGVCPAGSSIRQIFENGGVVCEPDTVGNAGSLSTTWVTRTDGIPSSIILRQSGAATATCPSTHRITGGGHNVEGGTAGVGTVDRSRPSGNGWNASVITDSVTSRTLRVYAVCARVL